MSRVIRRLRGGSAERGAVAVLVAILFGSGVLLGMGALVIDAGGMFAERAQLQNGADAGALAVAIGCAKGAATCDAGTGASGAAGAHANSNANDGKATVDRVCGVDQAGILASCSGSQPGCATAPITGNYAQVQTSTRTGSGGTLLPPAFGKAVLGAGYQGKQVHACAQVKWGSPRSAISLAMTISLCEWRAATNSGATYAPSGPYPNPTSWSRVAPYERTLQLHGTNNACSGSPSGYDMPGGFGWLQDTTGTCSVTIDLTGIYYDNTGNSPGRSCRTVLQNAVADPNHSPVYIPVFNGYCPRNGSCSPSPTYLLSGFAEFVITGYNIPSVPRQSSIITGTSYCTGNDFCVYGFFTSGVLSANAGAIGGVNYGAVIVQMVG